MGFILRSFFRRGDCGHTEVLLGYGIGVTI